MTASDPFEDRDGRFLVLVNSAGQHSLWPADVLPPRGWVTALGPAARADCDAYVEEHWSGDHGLDGGGVAAAAPSRIRRRQEATVDPRDTRIDGWRGSGDYLTFAESDGYDADALHEVLAGRRAGVVMRSVFGQVETGQLVERFDASPHTRRRLGDAPGSFLGAYHYLKPTQQYLDESADVRPGLDSLLADFTPDEDFRRWVGGTLGVPVRRAVGPCGGEAARCLLRSWDATGSYSLEPHEDESQCLYVGQSDFEVQRAAATGVFAVNICLSNTARSDLQMWNIRPSQQAKRDLGLSETGWPYPDTLLRNEQTTRVSPRAGDVYVFNGSLIHAVGRPDDDGPDARRVNLSYLMARAEGGALVTWT